MSGTVSDNTSQSSGSVTAAAGGISIVSSDPTLTTGLLWYNSTSNVLKVARTVGAWANGGNLAAARYGPSSSTNGTQSAAIAASGWGGSAPITSCEEYDGSSWSGKNAMLIATFSGAGAGTASAALAISGEIAVSPYILPRTEAFDGTSWTSADDLNTERAECNLGCGTLSAALTAGGWHHVAVTATTEEYNGTSWVNVNPMITGAKRVAGCGIQTAAIGTGHWVSAQTTTAEQYDGTSWSSLTSRNTELMNPALSGTLSLAVCFGGNNDANARLNVTEDWNGTAWSVGDSLTTARSQLAGSGTALAALSIGGNTGSQSVVTEAYTGALTAKTLSNS